MEIKKYRSKITEIREEGPGIIAYILEIPDGLTWEEGAHMHVAVPFSSESDEVTKGTVRHLSVMSLPAEGNLSFTTKISENPSAYKKSLSELKEGDELILFKFCSRLTPERTGKNIVILTQGIAVAAARPVILSIIRNPEGIKSLTSLNISRPGSFILKDELEGIKSPKTKLIWESDRDEFLRMVEGLSEDKDTVFYIAGGDNFICRTVSILKKNGVNPSDIRSDRKQEKMDILMQEYSEEKK